MKYTQEFEIDTFPFWGGAKEVVNKIKKAKKLDELNAWIDEFFYGQTPTKTQINDIVWFGYKDIMECLEIDNGEDDEET